MMSQSRKGHWSLLSCLLISLLFRQLFCSETRMKKERGTGFETERKDWWTFLLHPTVALILPGDFRKTKKGDDRGCDGWMASLTRWTRVWVNSGSWWWTGRPGVLRFMGSQRVGHDWVTELNWTELNGPVVFPTFFNLSLNLAIRNSWPEPQSALSLVFAD